MTTEKSNINSYRPDTLVTLVAGLLLALAFSSYSPVVPAMGYHMVVSAAGANARAVTSQFKSRQRKRRVTHIVRRGDTVYNIAGRYNISIAQLRRWNKRLRRNNYIAPGQRLRVYVTAKLRVKPRAKRRAKQQAKALPLQQPKALPIQQPKQQSSKVSIRGITHIVRRGDTVHTIAERYGVTVAQLRIWNKGLKRNNYVAPGQPLRMYVKTKEQQPGISGNQDRIATVQSRKIQTLAGTATPQRQKPQQVAFVTKLKIKPKAKTRPKAKKSIYKRFLNPFKLSLRSQSVAVVDLKDDVILYRKRMNKRLPIASLTKLMTAMVILDSRLNLNKPIQITWADKDWIRGSGSRLRVGTVLRRKDLLYMALAASENRASHALARTYPGGKRAFLRAMNRKARSLGMKRTRFADSSGLSGGNKSTARDLVRMVRAANNYPVIRRMSTSKRGWVRNQASGRMIRFRNTNRLVRRGRWDINLSKTGFINEAGYCMVMNTVINRRPVLIVLLKAARNRGKYNDAKRIKHWVNRGVLVKR